MQIRVDSRQTGNPFRGHHNWESTIVFTYDGPSWYTDEKERAIVDVILGGPAMHMWYRVTQTQEYSEPPAAKRKLSSTWNINHGYDSGD